MVIIAIKIPEVDSKPPSLGLFILEPNSELHSESPPGGRQTKKKQSKRCKIELKDQSFASALLLFDHACALARVNSS